MINLEFIINTLSLGSLYAMLALGLVIVYGILRLVNFAYGELIMIGGYTLYLLTGFTPLPWLVVAVIAVFVGMFTSLLTELVAFRPVREKSLIALAVAHAVQCPYCIDAYTRASLEAGSNMEEMTEAIHVAAAIRGGATLIHGIQVHNVVDKITI